MPIQEGRGLKNIFSGSLCYELERGGRRSSGAFTEKMQLYRVCVLRTSLCFPGREGSAGENQCNR